MGRRYTLQDVKEPQLYEEMFRYDMIPKITFDNEFAKAIPAEDYWITCTTFRDGQQARPPYTVEQIVELYKLMHKLGGPKGIIRQCEFFLYSDKDKKAVEECMKLGYRYPEITGWIRAKKEDFKLVKQMGLKETGILTSASDYHIFLKLNKNRAEAMRDYLEVVDAALAEGVVPRCHLEDITRADFYGFIIPFVQELMRRADESKIPIKIRACDTLGYGVPYPNATLPRSVPKLIRGLIEEGGVPSERLEWHGHNDFHKVLINAEAAWLYGCSAANGTLLGFGERTGNPPIEGLIIEYVALKGEFNGVDTTVITEIGDYFKKAIKESIPKNYPFVGDEFNVTRAGIHADGGIKNEMIYNIFDTRKLLNRPMGVGITDKSGIAGIVYWINNFFGLKGPDALDKQNPGAQKINEWVTDEYKNQRITSISDQEMIELTKKYLPELFVSELEALKAKAKDLAYELISDVVKEPDIMSMDPDKQEPILQKVMDNNPFIKLIYITDAAGRKVTKNITQQKDVELYRQKLQEYGDFSDRAWFKEVIAQRKVYFSDLYTSKVTELLCITVSAPILSKENNILGVLGIDIKFDDLI
ncbi:MAG: cache domain-containing protein [Candidatus Omnitrophota bacterium]|nr:cache domain-containing protein [Candidatus Omnitrophota bacterium]